MTGNGLRLRARHRTELAYAGFARESVNEARLLPVDGPRTHVERAWLEVSPDAAVHVHHDVMGNDVAWFQVAGPHRRLVVDSHVVMHSADQSAVVCDMPASDQWAALDDPGYRDAHAEYLMRSPHAAWGPRVAALADVLPPPGRDGVARWVDEMAGAVHASVAYTPGATMVDTPVEVVAAERRGVCQDLAHLAIALFRMRGVPARYVSGWLHDPARGAPGESHAWVEVHVPGWGWYEVDPTHPEPITSRWMRVAIGRDYADVTPLRGTYQGDATESMTVTVETEEEPAPPVA